MGSIGQVGVGEVARIEEADEVTTTAERPKTDVEQAMVRLEAALYEELELQSADLIPLAADAPLRVLVDVAVGRVPIPFEVAPAQGAVPCPVACVVSCPGRSRP
jgi:hypothetical protein